MKATRFVRLRWWWYRWRGIKHLVVDYTYNGKRHYAVQREGGRLELP